VDTDEDFIEKLVKIAENGCWAYRLIVESVYPLIISEVTKRIDSFNPEYQDIVQDLALRVDYWLKKYDPTKGAFSTYVVASIHNYLVNNWIRSSGKKRMWETCFADLKLEDPDADAEDYQVYSRSKSALRNSGGDVPSVVATRMAADTVRDRLEVVSGNGVSVTDVNYTKLRFGLLRGRGEYSPTVIARLVGRTDKHVMHRIAKVRETLARDETTRRLAREFSIGIDDGKR
jgi:RNA polymerase sigma factor (sigma-70 family)